MPLKPLRKDLIDTFLLSMATRNIFSPPESLEEYSLNFQKDLETIVLLEETHYLNGRPPVPKHLLSQNTSCPKTPPVPKHGNLYLAWEFSQDPAHHQHFINMLRVLPLVFLRILDLIKDHNVFRNDTNLAQAPVEKQLAVTLFQMGRYGDGVRVEDIACAAGCLEGSVENYTNCCFEAILSLQAQFV
jgi:hypothetical protein